MVSLNASQLKAVHADPGRPLIIQAGPGSGKTATLISRIAHIYAHNKAQPDISRKKLLVLAFSTSAAHEVRERLTTQCNLSPADLELIEVKTYHSFCYKAAKTYYKELHYTYPPMLCGNKTCYKYLEKYLDKKNYKLSRVLKLYKLAKLFDDPHKYLEDLGPFDGIGREGLAVDKALIIAAFDKFNAEMRQNNHILFADMILLANELFSNPKLSFLLKQFQDYYHDVFVDEFQDTNSPQLKFLFHLAPRGRITVVGDKNQSIYGFQGASSKTFVDFNDFFASKSIAVQMISLSTNYRSVERIIHTCNVYSRESTMTSPRISDILEARANNANIGSKTSTALTPSKRKVPFQSSQVAKKGNTATGEEDQRSMLTATQSPGMSLSPIQLKLDVHGSGSITFIECLSHSHEFEYIIHAIHSILDTDKEIGSNDIAVLYRTNEVGNNFKSYLSRQPVEFTFDTSLSFLEDVEEDSDYEDAEEGQKVHITDARDVNPMSQIGIQVSHLFHLIGKSANECNLPLKQIVPLHIQTSNPTVCALISQTEVFHQNFIHEHFNVPRFFILFALLFAKLPTLQTVAICQHPALLRFVETLPKQSYGQTTKTLKNWISKVCDIANMLLLGVGTIENIMALVAKITFPSTASKGPELDTLIQRVKVADRRANYDVSLLKRFESFIRESHEIEGSSVSVTAADGSAQETVKKLGIWIGTIHKSKGREWKYVFLLHANTDVFREIDFETHSGSAFESKLCEDERVAYVALSRPIQSLHVIYQGQSKDYPDMYLAHSLRALLSSLYQEHICSKIYFPFSISPKIITKALKHTA